MQRFIAGLIALSGLVALASSSWAQSPPASEKAPDDLVVVAPTCDTPDAYYRFAREEARKAEAREDYVAAGKWWRDAVSASRCATAPDPAREIIALAGQGMAQLYTGANRSAAQNLNASLDALLAEEGRKGRNPVQERNLAAVFALREALSAKLGKPITPTGSRIVSGRVPEARSIRRNYFSSFAVLLRPLPGGGQVCIPALKRHPALIYPTAERKYDSVGAVVVRLDLDPAGGVRSAAIVGSAPAGNAFENPAMEEAGQYRLDFGKKRGCQLPQDLLISFRFRSRTFG